MKPIRIHPCGLAVTLDGTVLINVSHFAAEQDPETLLCRALDEAGTGGTIFVGLQLGPGQARDAIRRLDDRAAEAAGVIAGQRQRRRRAKERKNGRRDS